MGKFIDFTNESSELLFQIKEILSELSQSEIDGLGDFLVSEFFDEDSDGNFTVDTLENIIEALGVGMYEYILEMLLPNYLGEGVSRVLKNTNKNKKTRKFMSNSKADLRKTKVSRKKDARANKTDRKRYQRANKAKISKYQKSRSAAIKKGTHKVKKRRNT